jgi:hypothetical protein
VAARLWNTLPSKVRNMSSQKINKINTNKNTKHAQNKIHTKIIITINKQFQIHSWKPDIVSRVLKTGSYSVVGNQI